MQERIGTINNISENHVFKTAESAVETDYVLLCSDLEADDPNYPDYYDVAHITLVNSSDVVGATYLDLLEIVTDYIKQKCRKNKGNIEVATELESVITHLEQVIIRLENVENKVKG